MNRLYLYIYFILVFINSTYGTIYTCDPTISCGCSLPSAVITKRIVGGETAKTNAWRWMASLQNLKGHRCGASLISTEYAVTAAHCISQYTPISEYSIIFGTNNLTDLTNTTAQQRQILNYYIHPNYNLDGYINDIAILQFLPLNITSSSSLSIICLPMANEDPFTTSSNLVAIGWGSITQNGVEYYSYLQQVTLQVLAPNSDACIQSDMRDPTTEICAGVSAGDKDACHGDSGGPLMVFSNNRWVLAGIISSGRLCATLGYAGIYTRVSAFIPFIQNITNFSGITVSPGLPTMVSTLETTLLTSQAIPLPTGIIILQEATSTNGVRNQKKFSYELISFIFCLIIVMNI